MSSYFRQSEIRRWNETKQSGELNYENESRLQKIPTLLMSSYFRIFVCLRISVLPVPPLKIWFVLFLAQKFKSFWALLFFSMVICLITLFGPYHDRKIVGAKIQIFSSSSVLPKFSEDFEIWKPFWKAFVLYQSPEVYRVYPRSSFGEYIFQNGIAGLQSPFCTAKCLKECQETS